MQNFFRYLSTIQGSSHTFVSIKDTTVNSSAVGVDVEKASTQRESVESLTMLKQTSHLLQLVYSFIHTTRNLCLQSTTHTNVCNYVCKTRRTQICVTVIVICVIISFGSHLEMYNMSETKDVMPPVLTVGLIDACKLDDRNTYSVNTIVSVSNYLHFL